MYWKTYKDMVMFGVKQVSNYRSEMWLGIFNKLIGFVALLILWALIYKDNKTLNVREILSYLLVANSVRDAIDAQYLKLSKEIILDIKQGTISSSLLRPVNTKLFFYFRFTGSRMINLISDVILFAIGITINPPKSGWGVVLFLISVVVATGLAYCFNVLVGMISFWTTEAINLRNVANHIIKVFSGSMVPLDFFSDFARGTILLLPFPVISYLPAVFITGKISTENIISLVASFIWLLILIPVVNFLWLKGIKDYDAVGI